MGADTSGLRALAKDFGAQPALAAPLVRAVVVKGAVNVKKSMRREMGKSRHFGKAARDIDFDVIAERDSIAAEIGPAVGRGRGHAGGLAWIAYQGTATSSASVRDPQVDLDEEAPRFERALEDVLGGLL